jgi:hypothetical protein
MVARGTLEVSAGGLTDLFNGRGEGESGRRGGWLTVAGRMMNLILFTIFFLVRMID